MLIFRISVLLLASQYLQAYRLVCYLTNWAQYLPTDAQFFPSNVDPSLCTHLIYSFAKLSGNGLAITETNDPELYKQATDLKKSNPSLKIMIAVGGGDAGSTKFSNMVTNSASRAKFVKQTVGFLKKYNFDGLDLDWEFPANGKGSRSSDKKKFAQLCSDLKTAFKPYNFLLSAALSSDVSIFNSAYDIPALSKYLSFFNIMTYDYHGSWDSETGANTPLFSSDSISISDSIDRLIKLGMPSQMINLGMASYGISWTLKSNSSHDMGSPTKGLGLPGQYTDSSGTLAYFEICQYLKNGKGWARQFDDVQKVPFMYNGNQWVSYDDQESLGYKVDYIKEQNIGGAMFWTIDMDDFGGNFCNNGSYPLINFVKSKLNNS